MKKKIYSAKHAAIENKKGQLKNIFTCFLFMISVSVSAQNPLILKNLSSGVPTVYFSEIVNTSSGKTFFNSLELSHTPGLEGMWITDGTPEGTTKLNTPSSRNISVSTTMLTSLGNDKVIFAGDNRNGYGEIWVSDGTQKGTLKLEQFSPGWGGGRGAIFGLVSLGNVVICATVNDDQRLQLYKTDGTPSGTVLIYDFGSVLNHSVAYFKTVSNVVYFQFSDFSRTSGFSELWRTDGTTEGTYRVKDLGGDNEFTAPILMAFNNNVYFIAGSPTSDNYIWKSDGTEAGTVPLKQISATGGTVFLSYAVAANLYFIYDDIDGVKLWKTDGSADGTSLATEIVGGRCANFPEMVMLNDVLYFSASSPATRYGLWKFNTKGSAGAEFLKDIDIDYTDNYPQGISVLNNTVLFRTQDAKLWVTDGSAANTINIGEVYSNRIIAAGDTAYFLSHSDVDGDGVEDPCIYKYIAPQKIWTGNVSSDASDVNNWFPAGVPTSTDNVLFPVTANNPVNDPVLFLNDFVNNGSTVNIGSGYISVNGNIYNEGTVNNTGSGIFSVSGATTSDHTFGSPGVFNGEVTLSGNVNLHLTSSSYIPTFRVEGNDTIYTDPYSLTTDKFILAPPLIILGNGSLSMPVGNTPVTFPVGIGNKSYTPVTITNNSGFLDYFNVSMKEGVFKNGITGDSITQQVVNKTWDIYQSTNNSSPNANITLQWNASDELPGFDRNNVYLNHYTLGAWDSGTPGIASGAGPYTFTRNGLTSFSPFSISSSTSALPVTLISFSANKLNNTVRLNWQTASEINASFYVIEKSADGATFSKIGQVSVLLNNAFAKNYSYIDAQPLQGANYYRLKMTDADGKFTYSKIVAVKIDGKSNTLQIYPNPAKNILNVQVNGNDLNEDAILQIIDIAGRKVKEERINLKGSSSFSVDVSQLSKGTYNVLLKGKSMDEQSKFVKE